MLFFSVSVKNLSAVKSVDPNTALDSVPTRSVAVSSLKASSHLLVVSSSTAFNSSPARSAAGGARSERQEEDKLATSVEKLQQTN